MTTGAPEIPPAAVMRWRFERHHLAAPAATTMVDVSRRIAGVHAQLTNTALHSLQRRLPGATPAKVHAALHRSHTLVKTWAVRGTLHLLPAADLPWWCAALSTRRNHTKGSWLKYHGVTAEGMDAILRTVPEALDGRTLTREELTAEIVRRSGRADVAAALQSGWGAVLKPAAARGLLCFGPPRGRNVTFVSPRTLVKRWPDVAADDAIDALVRAYLGAYGPATRHEFERWSALEPRDVKASFARLAGDLVDVTVDGVQRVVLAEHVDVMRAAKPRGDVALLPSFDPYVTGALRHLPLLLPDGVATGAVSRAGGWITPVVVVDGAIAGTWSATRTKRDVSIDVSLFAPQAPRKKKLAEAIDAEVERTRAIVAAEPEATDATDATDETA